MKLLHCHPERRRSCVTIDGAGGGVKDLEFHSGFLYQILRFAQNDNVLRSECTSVGEVRLSLDPR